jgi:hypothetical protein
MNFSFQINSSFNPSDVWLIGLLRLAFRFESLPPGEFIAVRINSEIFGIAC